MLRDAVQRVTNRVYKLGPYKKPGASAAGQEADPLEELARRAQEAGVPVEEG